MNFITKSLFKLDRQFFGLHLKLEFIFNFYRYILGDFWQKLGDIFIFSSGNTGQKQSQRAAGPVREGAQANSFVKLGDITKMTGLLKHNDV